MNSSARAYALAICTTACMQSFPLEAAEPAKPGSGAGNAGIIVLDGKAPPGDKGAKVSTGIGLGGCAACDKPVAGTKEDATDKLKNAAKGSATGAASK